MRHVSGPNTQKSPQATAGDLRHLSALSSRAVYVCRCVCMLSVCVCVLGVCFVGVCVCMLDTCHVSAVSMCVHAESVLEDDPGLDLCWALTPHSSKELLKAPIPSSALSSVSHHT